MSKRILVPLDGSRLAETALPSAETLARLTGGQLRLISVLEMPPIFAYPEFRSEDRERAEAYLARVSEQAAGRVDGALDTVVREGHVAAEILAEVREWNADLIVMASHGRGGVSRLWLGSIADRCIRHAGRPVLLVPSHPEATGASAAPFAIRRIVVPLDGSRLAEGALEPAAELARASGSPLELLRIVSRAGIPELTTSALSTNVHRAIMSEVRASAEKYLDETARTLGERGITVKPRIVEGLRPSHAILDDAGEDLIVMTTHGLSGLQRALLGSVADQVAHGAKAPVMILRGEPDDAES